MAVRSRFAKLSSVSPAVAAAAASAVVAVATAAASVRAVRGLPTAAVVVVAAATVVAAAVDIAAAVAAMAAAVVMVAVATVPAMAVAARCVIVAPTSPAVRRPAASTAVAAHPVVAISASRRGVMAAVRIGRVATGITSRGSVASTTTSRNELPAKQARTPEVFPPAFLFVHFGAMLCFGPSTEAGMRRRSALVGSLATLAATTRAKAQTLVDLQLVLAVDVSRSIDEVEAELQRRGYIEALTNDRVIDAILSGEHRRIAICYTEWAGAHYQVVVLDWTVIDSPSEARRFAEKLTEAPRLSQSWTAVGAALAHAGQRFDNSGFVSKRRVIDVSGDGRTNDGPPAEIVRDKLVSQGIVVNGLPVMMNRTNFGRPPDLTLDKYYEENVIGGPGSFMIVADNFDHFGRAVRTKLVREISDAGGPRRSSPA